VLNYVAFGARQATPCTGFSAVSQRLMDPDNRGFTLWFTGLPCAGKSTLARMVAEELGRRGIRCEILDGDEVRQHLSRGLGYSKEDRDENIRRIGFVCGLLSRHGVAAIVAAISPYRAARDQVRSAVGTFVEVQVQTPVEICAQRDPRGLYKKAFRGQLKNFTGVNDPYEPPLNPELVVDAGHESAKVCTGQVIACLERLGLVRR